MEHQKIIDFATERLDKAMEASIRAGEALGQKTMLNRAIAAVQAERLEDNTGHPMDAGYNHGIEDALRALRALTLPSMQAHLDELKDLGKGI